MIANEENLPEENPADEAKKGAGITHEMIQADAENLVGQLGSTEQNASSTEWKSVGLLKHTTANNAINEAKNKPKPEMLFDEFWYEGEVCILFADTNVGKSILAVQIGDSISKGECIPGFRLGAVRQKILYCDFELSSKQFENRYSVEFEQHYVFDDNFIRVELANNFDVPKNQTYEEYLNNSIEQLVIDTGAKVLIIDNLTYLRNETEKEANATPLMKYLKEMKNSYKLSILALAHTPKRDVSKPITKNDLKGSSLLMGLCDSSFAISESTINKTLRYIKQMKVRESSFKYVSSNVAVFEVNKRFNFLQFEFIEFGSERDHLRNTSDTNALRLQKIADIKDLLSQGISKVQIGKKMGVSEGAIRKFIIKNADDFSI